MFTITFRVSKKQVAAAAAVFVLAFAGGLWIQSAFGKTDDGMGQAQAAASVKKIEKAAGKTNEQRVEFLNSFGWEVEPQEAEVLDVIIPKEFDQVFAGYNEIQQAQGLDLSKYGGKQCKRYSYEVLNYPGESENIRANILVYKGKIIGGDVCSLELDGFMHGFVMEND